MKNLFIAISLFIFFLTPFRALSKAHVNHKFVIVITSYNNDEWYENNLKSALSQTYENYRIIYINDASTDNTLDNVQKFIAEHDIHHKITLIDNDERRGACANLFNAINSCEPDEIVIILDGDDWLAHENVLNILDKIYQNPAVWITYGQFQEYPSGDKGGARQLPYNVIAQNLYREYAWVTTHLKSFYASLFHQIKKDDLLYEGNFFPMAPDLAIMFPILELGGRHSKFIRDVLYIYNRATPINENKVNIKLQQQMESTIRNKERYQPLNNLPSSFTGA